jgi:hypothetical protein
VGLQPDLGRLSLLTHTHTRARRGSVVRPRKEKGAAAASSMVLTFDTYLHEDWHKLSRVRVGDGRHRLEAIVVKHSRRSALDKRDPGQGQQVRLCARLQPVREVV